MAPNETSSAASAASPLQRGVRLHADDRGTTLGEAVSETADLSTNEAVDDERDVEAVTATDASRQRSRTVCERPAATLEP